MTTTSAMAATTDRRAPPSAPTTEQVLRLQAYQGYPAVSLLLSTTAGPAMTAADALSLRRLLARGQLLVGFVHLVAVERIQCLEAVH